MRVLITGRGTSGSFRIRGEQLGSAIGARVERNAINLKGIDTAVVVKRVRPETLAAIRAARVPMVYDIVDAWPQPAGNDWTRDQARAWLRMELRRLAPNACVFATQVMLEDSGFGGPALVLPHHAWPKYRPVEIRERVAAVGYEGAVAYLGKWRAAIEAACRERGWQFVVNGDLQQCDIGIAMRESQGHPAKFWKSNCKLANLQALGLPAVCTHEQGYWETGSGAERYVGGHDDDELPEVFERLENYELRKAISSLMREKAPALDRIAAQYKQWILALNF